MASATVFHWFILLGVGGFLYLLFILIADVFGTIQNIFLANYPGVITESTVTGCNFAVGVILAAPFLVMITLMIWAVTRGASN